MKFSTKGKWDTCEKVEVFDYGNFAWVRVCKEHRVIEIERFYFQSDVNEWDLAHWVLRSTVFRLVAGIFVIFLVFDLVTWFLFPH